MKKLMAALLAAAATMVMSFTALASEDPAVVFDRVTAKCSAMDSMDTHMDMNMALYPASMAGEKLDISMAVNMQTARLQSGNPVYKMETAAVLEGETEFSTTFYKDGMYYMENSGLKIKYPMDAASMMQSAKSANAASNMISSMMKSITLEEVNGQRVLSYVADAGQMNAYATQVMGAVMGQTGNGAVMNIREVSGTYVLTADDYYSQMTMNMVMDMTYQGESVVMSIVMNGTVNHPGQPVEVVLPSTDGYQDMAAYLAEMMAAQSSPAA